MRGSAERRAFLVALVILLATAAALPPAAARGAEVTFGKKHEMVVDGKLFLPVHAWVVANKDLDRLKAMGVNVALGSGDAGMSWTTVSEKSIATMRELLDGLQQRQMYGVIILSAWWSAPEKRGIYKDKPLSEFMKLFQDHPALLGWQTSSEDDMGLGRGQRKEQGIEGWAPHPGATAADLKKRYDEVKKADPKHPVVLMYSGGQMIAGLRKFGWTVPTPEEFYFETAKNCDILYHDLFPVANNTAEDLKQIADATKLLEKYSMGRKHLWVAVDAGDRKRWTTKSHAPTGKEIRNELWQAVVHGAHGLGFDYTSWKPTWASIRMSEDGEKGLTAAVKGIQDLKEAILLGQTDAVYGVESTGEGSVDLALRRQGKKLYVFAVNVESKPCQATLSVDGLKARAAKVLGEDRTVTVEGGTFKDTFDAYAVHLYEIDEQ